MNFTFLGALLGFLSVALGAFGAHALRSSLDPQQLNIFETGVRYQFLHALALLFVGRHVREGAGSAAFAAGWLFVAGIAVFSGSLYALALTNVPAWGAVTPVGGAALLAGWLALAWAFRGRA